MYIFNLNHRKTTTLIIKYSQTCIKRSPLGPRKSGLIRQVVTLMTKKKWPYKTGGHPYDLVKVAL